MSKDMGAFTGSREPSPTVSALTGFDPERIPVITLWQPWASLIFSGHKLHETRGYPFPRKYLGERIAIHAAARPCPRNVADDLAELCYDAFGCGWNYSLPRGAILGTVKLAWPVPTAEQAPFSTEDDIAAGDWTAGRWAWRLFEPKMLPAPLPAKGKQGWWSIDTSALAAATGTAKTAQPVECEVSQSGPFTGNAQGHSA